MKFLELMTTHVDSISPDVSLRAAARKMQELGVGALAIVDAALPEGFIYDTCRAVISLGELRPKQIFSYFSAIQLAFYIDQNNVTQPHILANLATQYGVAEQEFLHNFHSDAAKHKIQMHFQSTYQASVRGFPSLALQQGNRHEFITRGYQTREALMEKIDAWLAA